MCLNFIPCAGHLPDLLMHFYSSAFFSAHSHYTVTNSIMYEQDGLNNQMVSLYIYGIESVINVGHLVGSTETGDNGNNQFNEQ